MAQVQREQQQDIELHSAPSSGRVSIPDSHEAQSTEIEQTPLPPTDTGKAAWLVLAGCSLIQAPVWGTWI